MGWSVEMSKAEESARAKKHDGNRTEGRTRPLHIAAEKKSGEDQHHVAAGGSKRSSSADKTHRLPRHSGAAVAGPYR